MTEEIGARLRALRDVSNFISPQAPISMPSLTGYSRLSISRAHQNILFYIYSFGYLSLVWNLC